MPKGVFQVPMPVNEPVRSYAVGTADRDQLLSMYKTMYNQSPIDVPMYIGSELVRTADKRTMSPPHDHQKVLGYYNWGGKEHVK
ncbi:MAG: 1-pyrroline-5-carboxylate dehydrogenase, partial [Flavobacteriales bacterium]